MKQNLVLILLSTFALSACAKSTESKQATNNTQSKEIIAIAQLDSELQKKSTRLIRKNAKRAHPC